MEKFVNDMARGLANQAKRAVSLVADFIVVGEALKKHAEEIEVVGHGTSGEEPLSIHLAPKTGASYANFAETLGLKFKPSPYNTGKVVCKYGESITIDCYRIRPKHLDSPE
ncbi:MAG TPA: hypothetical protein VLE93_02040 [Candidatus Saccharimonadales bacterium]|nr:hypothetical protein [Candidatus Saccharimonadales bacterium]